MGFCRCHSRDRCGFPLGILTLTLTLTLTLIGVASLWGSCGDHIKSLLDDRDVDVKVAALAALESGAQERDDVAGGFGNEWAGRLTEEGEGRAWAAAMECKMLY